MKQAPRVLLAKSCENPDAPPSAARYVGHTASVVGAARELLKHRGEATLDAAGLPSSLFARLAELVLLASALHDLGKASSHFQKCVREGKSPQLVRHEAVSAWLAWQEPLRSWLEQTLSEPKDLPLVLAAVAGHHRKFVARAVNDNQGLGSRMLVFSGHRDVGLLLRFVAKTMRTSSQAPKLSDTFLTLPRRGPVEDIFEELESAVEERLASDELSQKLLALAKALLINADVAGSALPLSEGKGWIGRVLTDRANRDAIQHVIHRRLKGGTLRIFQEKVAECAGSTTLVQAACGGGKTVAAYAWFLRQHLGRQLWITYPTTGTALEGFRDYLHGIDDLVTDLESGRREVDLEMTGILEQGDQESVLRDADRVASLRAWGKHAIACTVDTVLGAVQNQRKGLYAWAGLSQSAIVFDEIHSYDERLFGALLKFLEYLPGIPVLLMTASLPAARLDALRRVAIRRGDDLRIVAGDRAQEELPRYHIVQQDPSPLVRAALDRGEKVLWVSNTVQRCLDVADWGRSQGYSPLVYHSRFRYEDRISRHKDIIRAFHSSESCLVMSTQVAEMSLDISADLLITDLAPVPALIQRLGRLNRYSRAEDPKPPKTACVLPVDSAMPYETWDPVESGQWLSKLTNRDSSQADLVAAWESGAEAMREGASAWFEGGFHTMPNVLRSASPGVVVMRAEDLAEYRRRPEYAALPMPAPRTKEWTKWERCRHLLVAPAGSVLYDPMRGAQWAE